LHLAEPQRADKLAFVVIEKVAVCVGTHAPDPPRHVVGEIGLARSRTAIEDNQPAPERLNVSRQLFPVLYKVAGWYAVEDSPIRVSSLVHKD
jgi:hypothetical protein